MHILHRYFISYENYGLLNIVLSKNKDIRIMCINKLCFSLTLFVLEGWNSSWAVWPMPRLLALCCELLPSRPQIFTLRRYIIFGLRAFPYPYKYKYSSYRGARSIREDNPLVLYSSFVSVWCWHRLAAGIHMLKTKKHKRKIRFVRYSTVCAS